MLWFGCGGVVSVCRLKQNFLHFLGDIKYFHGVRYDRITLLSSAICVLFNT